MKNNRKLIAIVGPTASGKTAIGVKLAKEFNGEIVSADSRQVFRGLDLGTGKDLHEYGGVKYHLIDVKNPGEKFTLFDYLSLARKAIEDIFSRGKIPIVVGGTGLYIQGLVEGFELENNNHRRANIEYKFLREELNNKAVEELQDILKEINSKAYDNLADKQNPHRLIRAIEKAQAGEIVTQVKPDFEALQIGLEWPREELNKRIDKRVDDRFQAGMLEEVEGLLKSGVDPEWLLKLGLEYKFITQFLLDCHSEAKSRRISEILRSAQDDKKSAQDINIRKAFKEAKDLLKLRSHQYAKRQMTWFKRFLEIVWAVDYKDIETLVEKYLN